MISHKRIPKEFINTAWVLAISNKQLISNFTKCLEMFDFWDAHTFHDIRHDSKSHDNPIQFWHSLAMADCKPFAVDYCVVPLQCTTASLMKSRLTNMPFGCQHSTTIRTTANKSKDSLNNNLNSRIEAKVNPWMDRIVFWRFVCLYWRTRTNLPKESLVIASIGIKRINTVTQRFIVALQSVLTVFVSHGAIH